MATVRKARLDDAREIATIHLTSYNSTYAGVLPADYLASQSLDSRIATWEHRLREPAPKVGIYVAGHPEGGSAGFAWGGPARSATAGYEAELYSIYLISEAQRHGLGTSLVKTLAKYLLAQELYSMAVWVLAANSSRLFYEALGGRLVAERQIELGGQPFLEVAYAWTDLSSL